MINVDKDTEIFDLESLIVDGVDNFIPLRFEYPNTDKVVGVFVRPIKTVEFTNAARQGLGDIFVNVLSETLYDNNKNLIPREIIEKLPAGITIELYKKVAEISGIPTENKEKEEQLTKELMGF